MLVANQGREYEFRCDAEVGDGCLLSVPKASICLGQRGEGVANCLGSGGTEELQDLMRERWGQVSPVSSNTIKTLSCVTVGALLEEAPEVLSDACDG